MASSSKKPLLTDEQLKTGMKLEYGEDGTPKFTIDKSILDILAKPWQNSLIIRVIGTTVSFKSLSRKIKEIWNPTGTKPLRVIDIPNDHFIVRFESEADLGHALTGGPWFVFGHYLAVKKWYQEFDPYRNEISSSYAWVRITGLPLMMYDPEVLMAIASGIGKPVKVDERRLGRVCVEVDLLRPLKSGMVVDGTRAEVEYEGNIICSGCRRHGHLSNRCPSSKA